MTDSALHRYEKVTAQRACAFCHAKSDGNYWRADNSRADVLGMMVESNTAWSPGHMSRLLSSLTYLCLSCSPPACDVEAVRKANRAARVRKGGYIPSHDAQSLRGKIRAIKQQARKVKGSERRRLLLIASKYEHKLAGLNTPAPDDGKWAEAQFDAVAAYYEMTDHTPWFGAYDEDSNEATGDADSQRVCDGQTSSALGGGGAAGLWACNDYDGNG